MEFEDIVRQNPWWKAAGWEEEDRHLRQLKSQTYVYERPDYVPLKDGAIILYGPRQIGKTTWIKKQILELSRSIPATEIFYLDAEMIKDRFELYEIIQKIDGIYHPKHIFIDEITAVEDWERAIKALVDEGMLNGKRTLLTGSSSINILKKTERLPGRMAQGQYKYRFYPLSFREVAKLYGIEPKTPKEALANLGELNSIFYKYLLHGGYVRAMNKLEQTKVLDEDLFSVYSAWIDGELSKVKRSSETATQILDGITLALTNDVSWSSLSKTISHPTVADYAETLKNMFVIDFLEKERRANRGAPKNKKIYFVDPFLYWLALFRSRKISSAKVTDLDSVKIGVLSELCVYATLVQHLDRQTQENDFDIRRYVHFEKDRAGEVDFVVGRGSETFSLECKSGKVGKEKDGVIYLTQGRLEENKLPLVIFLMFPFESISLVKKK